MAKPILYPVGPATTAAQFEEYFRATHPDRAGDPFFFAEGDSWFNKVISPHGNLLAQMDLPRGVQIVDHSWPGDKASEMFSSKRLVQLSHFLDLFDYKAILLSAGGNDLISRIDNFLDGTGNDVSLNAGRANSAMDAVIDHIRRFCDERAGTRNAQTKVLIHDYDFVVPRNAPVKTVNAGPHVYRAFKDRHTSDSAVMIRVTKELLLAWRQRLVELTDQSRSVAIADFHLLDSQGLLDPADPVSTGRSADWEDEIHPTKGGYKKICEALFNPVMRSLI